MCSYYMYHFDISLLYLSSQYLEGLGEGLNLNPDIICNQRIKFHALLKYLTKTLNVEMIATGHYARIKQIKDG